LFAEAQGARAAGANAIYVSPPWPGSGIWVNYTVQLEVIRIDVLPE